MNFNIPEFTIGSSVNLTKNQKKVALIPEEGNSNYRFGFIRAITKLYSSDAGTNLKFEIMYTALKV